MTRSAPTPRRSRSVRSQRAPKPRPAPPDSPGAHWILGVLPVSNLARVAARTIHHLSHRRGDRNLRIDRRARCHLSNAGGLLTLEGRAKTGCMVTRQVEARVGKPDNPDAYLELDVGGITVFVQGTIEANDGTVQPSPGAIPRDVRVSERAGHLTVAVDGPLLPGSFYAPRRHRRVRHRGRASAGLRAENSRLRS